MPAMISESVYGSFTQAHKNAKTLKDNFTIVIKVNAITKSPDNTCDNCAKFVSNFSNANHDFGKCLWFIHLSTQKCKNFKRQFYISYQSKCQN